MEEENRWCFIVAWNPHIARVERKCSVELLDILDVGRGLGSLRYLEINGGEKQRRDRRNRGLTSIILMILSLDFNVIKYSLHM